MKSINSNLCFESKQNNSWIGKSKCWLCMLKRCERCALSNKALFTHLHITFKVYFTYSGSVSVTNDYTFKFIIEAHNFPLLPPCVSIISLVLSLPIMMYLSHFSLKTWGKCKGHFPSIDELTWLKWFAWGNFFFFFRLGCRLDVFLIVLLNCRESYYYYFFLLVDIGGPASYYSATLLWLIRQYEI